MKLFLALSRGIDAVNFRIGKVVAWLLVAAILVSTANAIIRKTFDTSSNAWLELQWILFSVVFLLCAAWTLGVNEHIRIDIINNLLPRRARHWIDVIGHVFFLLPFTVVMIVTGLPFFLTSYNINEQSGNYGGLPQWPAKALIFVAFILLLFQGVSELIKRIAVMRGLIADPFASVHHPAEAEAERLLAGGKPDAT